MRRVTQLLSFVQIDSIDYSWLAKFVSLQDYAVDDTGDGSISRVAVNAKVKADKEGKYQSFAALVASVRSISTIARRRVETACSIFSM